MGRLIKKTWVPPQTYGLSRRDRMICEYGAYVPDPIATGELELDAETAAVASAAELAVATLNRRSSGLASTEAMARLLLRAESVASSRIEGLRIGSRRLLKAGLARDLGRSADDRGAVEILNNIDVMAHLVDAGVDTGVTPELLLEGHRMLFRDTSGAARAGQFRTEQNWIGGSEFSPCTAEFVPPPPELVPGLVTDLCAFCGRDDLPPVVQAALAHSRFETIHPFFDGNGRAGRALIHVILRRRGLAPRLVPPAALVLATMSRDYVAGLTATRHVGRPDSPEAKQGVNRWVELFAAAVIRSVADADSYDHRISHVQDRWRERLGRVRKGSAADLLLEALPGAPVVTVGTAARLIGRSSQAVNAALPRLLEAGVLTQTTIGRRNRAFEATDLIDTFNSLERQLASPTANTRTSEPVRPVPARRNPDP